jgi:hypothetical protein
MNRIMICNPYLIKTEVIETAAESELLLWSTLQINVSAKIQGLASTRNGAV